MLLEAYGISNARRTAVSLHQPAQSVCCTSTFSNGQQLREKKRFFLNTLTSECLCVYMLLFFFPFSFFFLFLVRGGFAPCHLLPFPPAQPSCTLACLRTRTRLQDATGRRESNIINCRRDHSAGCLVPGATKSKDDQFAPRYPSWAIGIPE